MRRREFLGGLGGAAAAWPLAVRAQQLAMPIVGYLSGQARTAGGAARDLAAFQQGLREAGYVDGQNVVIDYRWAEGQYDRLPALADELIGRPVAVIVAVGTDFATRAAKAATSTIPIVFHTAGDPVQSGLVASLNRPGDNITGVTTLNVEVGPKRLELMQELLPAGATTIALLLNPNNPNSESLLRETQAAARILRVQLRVLRATSERDIEMAVADWAQLRAGPLVIGSDGYFSTRSEQIGALMLRHAVPAISGWRNFVSAGGLMSYRNDSNDASRLVGVYTGRILKGEKPVDLPVQQSTKVELVLNLKAAKALGITIPLSLLGRADEVIE
jgi:putative ABC transport system substrate-binding protein